MSPETDIALRDLIRLVIKILEYKYGPVTKPERPGGW